MWIQYELIITLSGTIISMIIISVWLWFINLCLCHTLSVVQQLKLLVSSTRNPVIHGKHWQSEMDNAYCVTTQATLLPQWIIQITSDARRHQIASNAKSETLALVHVHSLWIVNHQWANGPHFNFNGFNSSRVNGMGVLGWICGNRNSFLKQ